MYMSIRYKLRARWFVVVVGSLLIVATVYQRYHYVVDLAGGAAFMIICVTTAPRLYAAIHRLVSTRDDG
jgi:membrane-associated phospholipid phosphatase